jgi:hypothetical protein
LERRDASEKLRRSLEDSIQAIASTVEVREPFDSYGIGGCGGL